MTRKSWSDGIPYTTTGGPMSNPVVELLAVWLLAYNDYETGDEKTGIEWAKGYLPFAKTQPHFGDCTKAPISCHLCIYEDFTARARAIIAALEAAGKKVVDREPTEEMISAAYEEEGIYDGLVAAFDAAPRYGA